MSRRTPLALSVALVSFALLVPATASAHRAKARATASAAAPATVTLQVGHLRHGKAPILSTLPVNGTLSPYVPGQQVQLLFFRNGHPAGGQTLDVHSGSGVAGTFSTRFKVVGDGRFTIQAVHSATAEQLAGESSRESFGVRYPSLGAGSCGRVVSAFKHDLRKLGYVPGGGRCMTARSGRAVLAYRKVNRLAHTSRAGGGVVRSVFAGRGAYHLKYPHDGKHVEVSIERQVLVIADGSKPEQTYPVSTGKPSTPTVRGHFKFYSRQPGFNSEGMYYSTYFHGGYAVHGYASVPPNYPASHGCVRLPIPDAHRVFDSISLGEDIFIY